MSRFAAAPNRSAVLARTIAIVAVAIAAIAIASTARTFSGTIDEPAHIAAGMQWLSTGQYNYDLQHPPLGRIATALGPYLEGARSTGAPAIYDEGAGILGVGAHYVNTLAAARHGVLPFFLFLALVVWMWGRRAAGEAGATLATILLVCNPNILAHSGLATTDVACAATTTFALFIALWWIDRPTVPRSLTFGFVLGLAVGSRLSAIAFIGAAVLAAYAVRGLAARTWRLSPLHNARDTTAAIAAAAFTAVLVIWALYRFAFGPTHPGGTAVPAPAFVDGVRTFLLHGSTGHPTFLLGTPSNHGWWYYFPVALAVKTPIPLLLLSLAGAVIVIRNLFATRDWPAAVPIVAACAMLAVSMVVRVDLGVRLVLPVYPLLAIVAAQGAVQLWQWPGVAARATIVALVALSMLIPVRAYPDWLSYFNPVAGRHPEHVLVDSNLDWGQDLYRLRDLVAREGIKDSIYVAYFGTADLSAAGVANARLLGLHEHRPGWIAASETYLAGEWVGSAYQWLLDFRPVARIGPSMRLWHIVPPPAATTDSLRR